ncbi:hypothetical protein ACSFXN_06695 [Planococcus sp. 1R117A]|uniref:hypothetical protein n=1 Tax=Planococcus sp. 1R117A TaxID=3447020 RepID=UPI003EDCA1AB
MTSSSTNKVFRRIATIALTTLVAGSGWSAQMPLASTSLPHENESNAQNMNLHDNEGMPTRSSAPMVTMPGNDDHASADWEKVTDYDYFTAYIEPELVGLLDRLNGLDERRDELWGTTNGEDVTEDVLGLVTDYKQIRTELLSMTFTGSIERRKLLYAAGDDLYQALTLRSDALFVLHEGLMEGDGTTTHDEVYRRVEKFNKLMAASDTHIGGLNDSLIALYDSFPEFDDASQNPPEPNVPKQLTEREHFLIYFINDLTYAVNEYEMTQIFYIVPIITGFGSERTADPIALLRMGQGYRLALDQIAADWDFTLLGENAAHLIGFQENFREALKWQGEASAILERALLKRGDGPSDEAFAASLEEASVFLQKASDSNGVAMDHFFTYLEAEGLTEEDWAAWYFLGFGDVSSVIDRYE